MPDAAAPVEHRLDLATDDGSHIAARSFEPAGSPRGVLRIAGATSVKQNFYAPLARWLAVPH